MRRFTHNLVLLIIILCGWCVVFAQSRIDYNNQQLFLSGANLAWINNTSFARDIGPGETDFEKLADIMLRMHDHGGNALRWWLHTDGTSTPAFDNSGFVSGPGEGTISDLKKALDLAWEREIGLKLCLWSFDMLQDSKSEQVKNRNKLMLNDPVHTQMYIDNSLIPMVDSLRGHPAIIAWEIFNEPEGMSDEFGWVTETVPMSSIQRFINMCAGAIHRTDSTALVTSGCWSFQAMTDVAAVSTQSAQKTQRLDFNAKVRLQDLFAAKYETFLSFEEIDELTKRWASQANYNYYLDSRLIDAGGDEDGTLDFYSVHYYDHFGQTLSPFHNPSGSWGLTKAIVIGEFPMQILFGVHYDDLFETLFRNGYAGALPWSWTDPQFSPPERMLAGMQFMWEKYRSSVDVNGISGDWPQITLISPVSGAVFAEEDSVILKAEATDTDGDVVLVEFFASDMKIGEADSEPYMMTWFDIKPDRYLLSAVATDNIGNQRVSNKVAIVVGTQETVRLEAEAAKLSGSPRVATGDASASGGAYVTMQQNGTITWELPGVPEAGTYQIIFVFRPTFGMKNQYINVNGVRVAEMTFDGNANQWAEAPLDVDLREGDNTIQMELFWGWMDLDYLAVPSATIVTSIAEPEGRPAGFSLQQNYPNPFNPMTAIRYSLESQEHVKLTLYNVLGRKVRTLVDAIQSPGEHTMILNAADLATGVYFYRIEAGRFDQTKRMLFLQ